MVVKIDLDISDESKCTGKPLTRLINLFKKVSRGSPKYAKVNFRFVQLDVLFLYAERMGVAIDILESDGSVALLKIYKP